MYFALTTREAEIIRQLLAERGITEYDFIGVVPEGKELPGSTDEEEIESVSGTVVTPVAAYDFWLDWDGRGYTFGVWDEVDMANTLDKEEILAVQQQLQQKKAIQ
jgi:hypothetical protein